MIPVAASPYNCAMELCGMMRTLKPQHRGFIRDMRDYAWTNGGLPTDEASLEAIALSFQWSRYNFRKWGLELLKKFFKRLRGSVLVFPADMKDSDGQEEDFTPDEQEFEIQQRRSEQARRAASEKHRLSRIGTSPEISVDLNSAENRLGVVEVEVSPPSLCNKNIGEEETTSTASVVCAASEKEFELIQAVKHRSVELGMSEPDDRMASRIVKQFPNLHPSEFPRFLNQRSPALWLHMTSQQMLAEEERKKYIPERKPTEREITARRLFEWAKREDEKQGIAL